MLFVLAWGLICFGVFKILGPVALLIFIAITIGALVVTTIRAWQSGKEGNEGHSPVRRQLYAIPQRSIALSLYFMVMVVD